VIGSEFVIKSTSTYKDSIFSYTLAAIPPVSVFLLGINTGTGASGQSLFAVP